MSSIAGLPARPVLVELHHRRNANYLTGHIPNCNRNLGATAAAIRALLAVVLADSGSREQTQATQKSGSSPNANAEIIRHGVLREALNTAKTSLRHLYRQGKQSLSVAHDLASSGFITVDDKLP